MGLEGPDPAGSERCDASFGRKLLYPCGAGHCSVWPEQAGEFLSGLVRLQVVLRHTWNWQDRGRKKAIDATARAHATVGAARSFIEGRSSQGDWIIRPGAFATLPATNHACASKLMEPTEKAAGKVHPSFVNLPRAGTGLVFQMRGNGRGPKPNLSSTSRN
jgi:hypothetical protein